MENDRFDRLARAWATAAPRRAILGGVVGGALGLTTLRPGEAKKKKKAPFCLNGQTVMASNKKKKQLLKQGAKPGACPTGGGGNQDCLAGTKRCNGDCIDVGSCCTAADCDPCLREICVDGSCECDVNTSRDGRDVCSVFRSCVAIGQTTTNPTFCCSGRGNPIPNAQFFCIPGNETCASDIDCLNSQHCVGNFCAPTYVAITGEQCAEKAFDICSNRNQCETALCTDNLCRLCTSNAQCGDDRAGDNFACRCINGICVSSNAEVGVSANSCAQCPHDAASCESALITYACWPLCGKSLK